VRWGLDCQNGLDRRDFPPAVVAIVSVAVQGHENCRDGINFPGIFLELFGFFLSGRRFEVAVLIKGLRGAISASLSA
jgi:hypothetical protein